MSHTIRATSTKVLGETDEVISARGAAEDISGELGQATGTGYFDAQVVGRIESALGPGLTDGVTGAIIEEVAPGAGDPADRADGHPLCPRSGPHEGLCPDSRRRRRNVSLNDLGPREIYLNDRAARPARGIGRSGDDVRRRDPGRGSSARGRPLRWRRHSRCGAARAPRPGTDSAGQARPHQARARLEPRRGERRRRALEQSRRDPAADHRCARARGRDGEGDAIADADAAGNSFMSLFTTFGTFSIAAGILLSSS